METARDGGHVITTAASIAAALWENRRGETPDRLQKAKRLATMARIPWADVEALKPQEQA